MKVRPARFSPVACVTVCRSGRGGAVALGCIVDARGEGAIAVRCKGPEVRHDPVLPEESVRVAGGVGAVSDNSARIVDPVGDAGCVPGKGAEVRHDPVLPEEGVVVAGGEGAVPDDLAGVVDATSRAVAASREGPEVGHDAGLPEEGVTRAGGVGAVCDDLGCVPDD